MRRWHLLGIAVVVLALVVIAWRVTVNHRADRSDTQRLGSSSATRRGTTARVVTGVIAGVVRDQTGAPIASARVCANLVGDAPRCASTNATGAYEIGGLAAVAYEVAAAAPRYRPARYSGAGRFPARIVLGPGERRDGVDVVLRGGAVELTGTVADVNGGPVAHARVRAHAEHFNPNHAPSWYPSIETDAAGAFSLWVAPGDVHVEAVADGYAFAAEDAIAPGRVQLLLTPEGSISGTVVDEVGVPVADATVLASWINVQRTSRTDESGHFRIGGLVPARYDVIARAPEGYGRSGGSILVGLGSQVGGIEIRLVRAARVSGRVETEAHATCPEATVTLHDAVNDRDVAMQPGAGGLMEALGVLPGTYLVRAHCHGYFAKTRHTPVVVAREDRVGLVWTMTAGAAVRGHVRGSDGAPIEGVDVAARLGDRSWSESSEYSLADGSYELAGLPPGTYTLTASMARVTRAEMTFTASSSEVIERNLTLDDAALIRGVVVDTHGRAVGRLEVRANRGKRFDAVTTSANDGTFTLAVKPGSYDVVAGPDWKHPIGEPQQATVAAAQTATVQIVVPPRTGTIRGTVVDSEGAPVPDAYVSAWIGDGFLDALDRLTINEHPVLTAADGSFVISDLGPGTYTVEAIRRGGGETRVKGIEVGSTIELAIVATGTIVGTVAYADGSAPTEMSVVVRAADSFFRDETFFRTNGAFTLTDIQAGTLELAVRTVDGLGATSLTLAGGETKRGVKVTLDRHVTLRGRFVEAGTSAPVAGYFVVVSSKRSLSGEVLDADDPAKLSGSDGRFATQAPRGPAKISALNSDVMTFGTCSLPLEVDLTGDIDIGDVPIVRGRTRPGTGGTTGFELGTAQNKLEVSSVDAKGPAAKAGVVPHDVITMIDGVTGPLLERCARSMLSAAIGRSITIGLARGATVTIVVAP